MFLTGKENVHKWKDSVSWIGWANSLRLARLQKLFSEVSTQLRWQASIFCRNVCGVPPAGSQGACRGQSQTQAMPSLTSEGETTLFLLWAGDTPGLGCGGKSQLCTNNNFICIYFGVVFTDGNSHIKSLLTNTADGGGRRGEGTCSEKRQNRKKTKTPREWKILRAGTSVDLGMCQLWCSCRLGFCHPALCEMSWIKHCPWFLGHSNTWTRDIQIRTRCHQIWRSPPLRRTFPGLHRWGSGLHTWQGKLGWEVATLGSELRSPAVHKPERSAGNNVSLNVLLNFNLELSTFHDSLRKSDKLYSIWSLDLCLKIRNFECILNL